MIFIVTSIVSMMANAAAATPNSGFQVCLLPRGEPYGPAAPIPSCSEEPGEINDNFGPLNGKLMTNATRGREEGRRETERGRGGLGPTRRITRVEVGGGSTWATVVRRAGRGGGGGGKGVGGGRRTVAEGREVDGERGNDSEDLDADAMDDRDGDEDTTNGLPPPRQVVLPTMPREAIIQRAGMANARLEEAKQQGASPRKIERAEQKARVWAEQVRQAGGLTPKSLGFSIKGEEQKVEKAARGYERVQKEISDTLEEIDRLQDHVRKLQFALERFDQRREAAGRKLAYLSVQKAAESLPLETLNKFRSLSSALAARADPEMEPVREVLALMVGPSVDAEIATGQTTSDDSDGDTTDLEVLGLDGDGENIRNSDDEADDRMLDVEWDHFDAGNVQEIIEARREFIEARREMREALAAASRSRAGIGGGRPGEGRDEDQDEGDQETVAYLTSSQIRERFRPRLDELSQRIDHLKALAAKERIPQVGAARAGTSGTAGAPRGEPQGQEGEGQRLHVGLRRLAREGADPRGDAQERGSGRAGIEDRWQTAEERDELRDHQQSAKRHQTQQGRGSSSTRCRARTPAPVTPVDPGALTAIAADVDAARHEVEQKARELGRVVEVNRQIVEQERLQVQQELERAAIQTAQAMGVGDMPEAQLAAVQAHLYESYRAQAEARLTAGLPLATFGPTGAPLREQQQSMRMASINGGGHSSTAAQQADDVRGRTGRGRGGGPYDAADMPPAAGEARRAPRQERRHSTSMGRSRKGNDSPRRRVRSKSPRGPHGLH